MLITKKKKFWQNYSFPIILLISIGIGSTLGILMGKDAMVFKPLGEVFINLMFTAVVPMVFVTIASAVGNMLNMKRLGKILSNMFFVFFSTGAVAAIIIFMVVIVFPPAEGVNIQMASSKVLEKISFSEQIVKAITVNDFVGLFSKVNMLPLILFSMLFGFCVSSAGSEDNIVAKFLNALSNIFMKLISIIMLYAPIGLGAYFASLIGEFGPQLLGAYAKAMLIYYPVCFLYFILAFAFYSYLAGGKLGVTTCFKNILPPAITAFATGSSIATLPVNLDAAKKMGVPKDIREIILPIGATMHMDGTCLASILKISFLFGIFGESFTGVETFLTAMLISVLSGVVMSGVPGGGLIGEMLIVNIYGFPPEAFPIIATLGFLVDPPATMVNAAGDSVSAMMVTRLVEGKNWLTDHFARENN